MQNMINAIKTNLKDKEFIAQMKIDLWKLLFWFCIEFIVLLIIAQICYECHIPMVNGWTNEIILKPY
jgi:hypothetical protein